MPSTHKKVIVRKLGRDTINGYVGANFIVDGKLEMLNLAGNLVLVNLAEVKGVYFVRDFGDSEELSRKTFATRPRTEGLWVRLRFRDNEVLEGMMPNDLSQVGPEGFLINPPDMRSNIQRIFIPRTALTAMNVVAVIGGGQQRRGRKAAAVDTRQVPMFGDLERP